MEVEALEGTALFPAAGAVTAVVITEGAVKTVVEPAEVMLRKS
jgi:predicted ribosome-associated RNA-binding protein Tma20